MTTKRQDLVQDMVDEHEMVEEQEARREDTPLLEVLDRALDKGVHIDGWIRVPVLGIDVLDLEFDVLIASFAKYLEYAAAVETTVSVGEWDSIVDTDSEDREGEQSVPHLSRNPQDWRASHGLPVT